MTRWPIALATALAAVAVFVGLVWLFQRRLLYIPEAPLPPVAMLLPGASEVEISTSDGLALGAWLVPPRGKPNGAGVLVFNGNAGNRAMRAPIAEAFSLAGYTALLFDYRGYGGNPGRPTEQGLIEDGLAAARYLASAPGVEPGRIVYYGESLGTGVAVAVSVESPPGALILRSPFESMVDVAKLHYPWLPVNWLLEDRYPSGRRIGGVSCPLLVVAGEEDGIVPHEHSRALFETAPMPVKRFISVAGADHNDTELIGRDVMRRTMRFLRDETPILR